MPKTTNLETLDRNARRIYGCSHTEALRLNGGCPLREQGSKARAYADQRAKASHRGISWAMTFTEWMRIWDASAHWAERGVGRGSYCMARNGDEGPYAPDNVLIQLSTVNARDGLYSRFPHLIPSKGLVA